MKIAAFAEILPSWGHVIEGVKNAIIKMDRYVYIPKL
jgi:hypothetical protein